MIHGFPEQSCLPLTGRRMALKEEGRRRDAIWLNITTAFWWI